MDLALDKLQWLIYDKTKKVQLASKNFSRVYLLVCLIFKDIFEQLLVTVDIKSRLYSHNLAKSNAKPQICTIQWEPNSLKWN